MDKRLAAETGKASLTHMYSGVDLAKAPLSTSLTLVGLEIDPGATQRLASAGLRIGSSFSLISKTAGGGRVALIAGTRIALGKSLLGGMRAEVVS